MQIPARIGHRRAPQGTENLIKKASLFQRRTAIALHATVGGDPRHRVARDPFDLLGRVLQRLGVARRHHYGRTSQSEFPAIARPAPLLAEITRVV